MVGKHFRIRDFACPAAEFEYYLDVPDKKAANRSRMSPEERRSRSELTKLLHSEPVIRGSLSVRERSCGKPNCKCVIKGEKHVALYLVVREDGKYRQIFVPRHLHDRVRAWVDNHHKAKALLEEISQFQHERLRTREV